MEGVEVKTYFDFAENDYMFLQKIDISEPSSYNTFCSLSQFVCERYLKHIVEEFVKPTSAVEDSGKKDVLRTHSLRKLCSYLDDFVPEFEIDTSLVYKAEGFYFSVRYPGDNSFFAKLRDVQDCMEAVDGTRSAIRVFLKLDNPAADAPDER